MNVLSHDGARWVAICDECLRPLGSAPWWAPERLTKRAKHPHGGCAAVLLDDLRTYLAGRETFYTAAARRGQTSEALTQSTRRVSVAYPEHAQVIRDLVDALWRNDATEGERREATVAYVRAGVRSPSLRHRRRAAA